MRKLIYNLVDGTKVATLNEAKQSGLPYTTLFENIVSMGSPLPAKRQALLDKYGFIPLG